MFLDKIGQKYSNRQIAELCHRSERTIRDWRRERFLIDISSLNILCKKAEKSWPKNLEVRDEYWYAHIGARQGWEKVIEKYGFIPQNEKLRKKRWFDWWEKTGKFQKNIILKPIPVCASQRSCDLAEFVGIMLGDGHLARYQLIITLHAETDKQYSLFVSSLIKNLFNVPVKIHRRQGSQALVLIVSRVELVKLCKKIGLIAGDKIKNQIDIPAWIKKSEKYSISCLRGLVDTDGCVFSHRYRSGSRYYAYKKISFTSYSEPLRRSVFDIMKRIGLKPRFAQRRDIRLDRKGCVRRYFDVVGTNNPKHLNRFAR